MLAIMMGGECHWGGGILCQLKSEHALLGEPDFKGFILYFPPMA